MDQNFQQVLRIVKAAYGDALFEKDSCATSCVSPSSDEDRLLCLSKKVEALHADKHANDNMKVEAMIEACFLI